MTLSELASLPMQELEIAFRKSRNQHPESIEDDHYKDSWACALPRTIFRDDGMTVRIEMIDGVSINQIIFVGTRSQNEKRAVLIVTIYLQSARS